MNNNKHSKKTEQAINTVLMEALDTAIPDEELLHGKTDFLKAAARAEQTDSGRMVKLQLLGSLARAAAILVVVLGLGWAIRYAFKPEVVIANRLDDFTAVVLSSFTNKVVPGVEVYRVNSDPSNQSREFIGVTGTNGIFNLTVAEDVDCVPLKFFFDGIEVAYIELGESDKYARGIYKVWVEVKPSQLKKELPVHLEPGEFQEFDSLVISLGDSSTDAWEGVISIDRAWPSIFGFAQVVDGIIRVEGIENSHLTVSLALSDTVTEEDDSYKLVSHSDTYEGLKTWRASFHHGWYNVGNPPENSLAHELYGISTENGKKRITWRPVINSSYVVLNAPGGDGEVAACTVRNLSSDGVISQFRGLELVNQTKPGNWLYEWVYYPVKDASPYYFPEYYHKFYNAQPLESSLGPRGAIKAGYKWPPMVMKDEFRLLPGEFSANRLDFTASDPASLPRISADYTQPVGEYELQITKRHAGEMSRVKLKGKLNRIAKPVEWDIDGDYVADCFGNEIEILIPSSGSYPIRAEITEKSGGIVVLKTKLNFSSGEVLGYLPGSMIDYPVVRGNDAPNAETESLWVMSAHSVPNLKATRYSMGNFAGSHIYVDPPDNFRGVPLKEVRLIAYASARAGDFDRLPWSFVFEPVTFAEGEEYPFTSKQSFSEILTDITTLSMHSTSWITRRALLEHEYSDNNLGATDSLTSWRMHPTVPKMLDLYLGLDLFDLPDEDKLVERLEEFTHGESYDVHYVTGEMQEVKMQLPLPGGEFGPEGGFYTGFLLHTLNLLLTAQWEIFSGEEYPTRVELETLDGQVYTQYFDYSQDY